MWTPGRLSDVKANTTKEKNSVSVIIPGFLGLVLKKNESTKAFIERELEFFTKFAKSKAVELNEDEFLIGFSVAMNGADLERTIEMLSRDGAILGVDFVATSSVEGVVGEVPDWLRIEERQPPDESAFDFSVKLLSYVEAHDPNLIIGLTNR